MNTKDNRRSRATKSHIEAVFLSLLKKHDISKISIQELCRRSEINRSTFYAHYKDVYDLFDCMEREMSKHTVDIFYDTETGTYKDFNTERYVELFEYIRDHRDFYQIYLSDAGRNHTINLHITEYGQRMLGPVLERSSMWERRILEYNIAYLNAGVNAIIRHWLKEDCIETPEELVEIMGTVNRISLFWET